jgi:hypothetical protein
MRFIVVFISTLAVLSAVVSAQKPAPAPASTVKSYKDAVVQGKPANPPVKVATPPASASSPYGDALSKVGFLGNKGVVDGKETLLDQRNFLLNRPNAYQNVNDKVDQGGFGAVRKTTNLKNGETVALKQLPAENRIQRDAIKKEQYFNEKLDMSAGKAFFQGKSGYIPQKFVEGKPLGDVIADPNTPLSRNTMYTNAANELKQLHAKGIKHGDATPNNFMISDRGTAKPIDFGQSSEVKGPRGDYYQAKEREEFSNRMSNLVTNVRPNLKPARRQSVDRLLARISDDKVAAINDARNAKQIMRDQGIKL